MWANALRRRLMAADQSDVKAHDQCAAMMRIFGWPRRMMHACSMMMAKHAPKAKTPDAGLCHADHRPKSFSADVPLREEMHFLMLLLSK